MSSIEEKVIDKIRSRAERGWTKYGTTMEREDLTFLEWAVHLQEELMDATIYIQKIINDASEAHPNPLKVRIEEE